MSYTYTRTTTEFVLDEVRKERERQLLEEGMTAYGDDQQVNYEIARGAAAYAVAKHTPNLGKHPERLGWPYAEFSFWPTTHRRNCVKAMAMLCAEIERIDRAAARRAATQEGEG